MVKVYKKDFHAFKNLTKYEKLIYSSKNKEHFKEYSLIDIKEDVLTNES